MTLDKRALRLEWIQRRQAIPSQRKIEASFALSNTDFPPGIIASFASFRNEIDTLLLNTLLAQKRLLALPKMESHGLTFYLVEDLNKQLALSPQGILEPIPSLCRRAQDLSLILVPGLAFDQKRYRLGYGKGYYDRYLAHYSIRSIGVGFKEQLISHLPHDPHDIPLDELLLF